LFVAGAAVATAALAVPVAAGAVTATTGTTAALVRSAPAVGKIAGVVPPLTARPERRATAAARAQAAGCAEPDCDLRYRRGPVQRRPHVYVVFWGPKWTSNTVAKFAARYLTLLYRGLGQRQDRWSRTTVQYGGKSGRPTFGASVLKGIYVVRSKPPKPLTLVKLAAEAIAAAKHFRITDVLDAQVVIAAQPGTCFGAVSGLQFTGNCGKLPASPSANGYCGWHAAVFFRKSYLTFTNLPFQLDAGPYCGENLINKNSVGRYDGFSLVGGHEYAESITDPVGGTGWFDPADYLSGGEIADKCAWGGAPFGLTDPQGDITLSTGKFAMQSLWSNARRGCVM
jgi:serine protease